MVTPAPGHRWNRLGDLCSAFYEQWRDASLPQLQETFRDRVDDDVALVTSLSREELFTSGLHLRAADVGLLDAVGLACGQVGAYRHGGALHLLPHEDPRLETPLSNRIAHPGEDSQYEGAPGSHLPPRTCRQRQPSAEGTDDLPTTPEAGTARTTKAHRLGTDSRSHLSFSSSRSMSSVYTLSV